ncbi:MAG TPA: ABC transporter permease [Reyranella sp.]|nr:ABC transporter permease [Reyranella sp.]
MGSVREARDDVPVLHVMDGELVVAERRGALARLLAFLAEPGRAAWRHRDLIAALLRRELAERFKGSVAGWVWAVVAPFLALATYTIAFSGVVKLPSQAQTASQFDYALFIFGGLIAYSFFSEMAFRAPSLLHEYAHFIKQTMFPAEMLPIISTLRATAYVMIGLVMMIVAQLVLSGTIYWTILLLPLWLVPFLAFLIGMTWFLAALGAFTRDASYLMMTLAPILLFATPVFWSIDGFAPNVRLLMYLNILTGFIEIIRDITVMGSLPKLPVVLWTLFLSVLTFYLGFWFFRRQRDRIADVI